MANVTTLSTEISDAFNKEGHGCALCSVWLDEEASLTEKIRKDGDPIDRGLVERVLAASGFCNRHTHAVHKVGPSANADGAPGCFAHARIVIKKFEEDLARVTTDFKGAKGAGEEPITTAITQLEGSISGDEVCPVCAELLQSDKARLESLLQMLESKDFAELYSKSRALCMPHFVSAMQLVPKSPLKSLEAVWSQLMKTQLASLASVDHLLNERMKKYSWDFRHEGMSPDEANAQKIAMLAIAGVEGLYCRPRKTSLRPAR
jgi:hypothetical protein